MKAVCSAKTNSRQVGLGRPYAQVLVLAISPRSLKSAQLPTAAMESLLIWSYCNKTEATQQIPHTTYKANRYTQLVDRRRALVIQTNQPTKPARACCSYEPNNNRHNQQIYAKRSRVGGGAPQEHTQPVREGRGEGWMGVGSTR